LVAAHSYGIVHRDIKPHNLLIGGFGQVKVCDFGISAIASAIDAKTQTQAFTLDYASPEQLDGGHAGPPSDVFSFSATLFHLLTGRRLSFGDRQELSTLEFRVPDEAAEITALLGCMREGLAARPERRPPVTHMRSVLEDTASRAHLGSRSLDVAPMPQTSQLTNTVSGAPTILRRPPPPPDTIVPPPRPVESPPSAIPAAPPALSAVGASQQTRHGKAAIVGAVAAAVVAAVALTLTLVGRGGAPSSKAVSDTAMTTVTRPETALTATPATASAPSTAPVTTAVSTNQSPTATTQLVTTTVTTTVLTQLLQPVSASATCQAPDGAEADGTPVPFPPSNVLDGVPTTAWRCAASAIGERLLLDFGRPVSLSGVGLIGGYPKIDPVSHADRFLENFRVRSVRWTFDDGSSWVQNLADARDMQMLDVQAVTTRALLEIVDVYDSTYPIGDARRREFVPIADVAFMGTPMGPG
jgi:hypothetical protein